MTAVRRHPSYRLSGAEAPSQGICPDCQAALSEIRIIISRDKMAMAMEKWGGMVMAMMEIEMATAYW